MIFGISHIEIPVSDLTRSTRLYVERMGLQVRREGEGWKDLESGTVTLRLVEVRKVEQRVSLRVQVADVAAALAELAAAGTRVLYEPMRTPALELVASVADPDGHTVTLWRELSEDEYGFVPELPTEMAWEPEAEALMKSLLSHVPALFRALARRKVVRNAEYIASERRRVRREDVIRAYILSSAKVTRYRLYEPLRANGIRPEDYSEEFNA
jgi:predicted enzyme related to lactoylglutathione lyase